MRRVRTALGLSLLLALSPQASIAEWTLATEAALRHDDNVGNSQYAADKVADSSLDGRLSIGQFLPLGAGCSVAFGSALGGEIYERLMGLRNAAVDGTVAVKKKWGMGAYAPWARAGVAIGRSNYNDNYRSFSLYRATLAVGRRIDARWNLWTDYAYEQREAAEDTFSQHGQSLALHAQYSATERLSLTLGASARRGEVISTSPVRSQLYVNSIAYQEDPALGDELYAYKLNGTTYGVQVALNYSLSTHTSVGGGVRRFDTRVTGGTDYAVTVAQLTWEYRY